MTAGLLQLTGQLSQFPGMGSIVIGHVLHQCYQLFHGGVVAMAAAFALAAAVMAMVVGMIMGMVVTMQMVMLMGMLMIMIVGVGVGMAVGHAVMGMLMGMGVLVAVGMAAGHHIVMDVHRIRSFCFFFIIPISTPVVKSGFVSIEKRVTPWYDKEKEVEIMDYVNCNLCPRSCGADRAAGQTGFCGCPDTALVAKAMLHKWEEPALAGNGGSGAIFFGGCTLKCSYCQNHAISRGPAGTSTDVPGLRSLMEDLIAQGAENIDLVTPTQYLPTILPALTPKLPVPVIYNCGGYECLPSLQALAGKIDIYLPDLKYADSELARRLSGAEDYFSVARAAILEMFRQTGPVQYVGDKVVKGVIIRHLILPGQVENSLKVLDWIGETFRPGDVLVSLMRQYTPIGSLCPPFDRPVTEEEYQSVLSWMYLNRLEGFTQEAAAVGTDFIPDFRA